MACPRPDSQADSSPSPRLSLRLLAAPCKYLWWSSRDKNTSPSQLTAVQIMDSIEGSVKRIGGCMQFHLALGGQGHELHQVIVVANQVANKVDLGGDNIDGRNSEAATVANDVVRTGTT